VRDGQRRAVPLRAPGRGADCVPRVRADVRCADADSHRGAAAAARPPPRRGARRSRAPRRPFRGLARRHGVPVCASVPAKTSVVSRTGSAGGTGQKTAAMAPTPDVIRARRWTLAATILGSSLAFIDGTVVNVALPALQADLNATITDVQWVIEAYALFLGSLILVGGSLGDQFGRRRVFLAGVAVFVAASVGCGV